MSLIASRIEARLGFGSAVWVAGHASSTPAASSSSASTLSGSRNSSSSTPSKPYCDNCASFRAAISSWPVTAGSSASKHIIPPSLVVIFTYGSLSSVM
ncbi:hypothetical protein FPH17_04670 [Corynebacterium godavarianum]|uniref:Secreted protein n=1 Tax=Corynebacterium godavarianum TaxID=2054421 RepID=A0ABY3E514_9CORY|nr:hypothetical protein [Corynebacterium godavarianum]MBL7285045.1 hypothetical protein [Corynebacterium godavarianum]TSJ74760.1 hypothetical protein FPH17_04670 [Corynebacterium godavarianum]